MVLSSRKPPDLDFLQVGVDAPRRPIRARSKESLNALQAELEGARSLDVARDQAADDAGRSVGKSLPVAPPPQPSLLDRIPEG